LATIPLRKPPKAYARIRVVSAGDFDHTPCGGTHPRRTGEVGAVVIRRWEKYKGGTRAEFVCGERAVQDYAMRRNLIQQLTTSLHIGLPELPHAVTRLQATLDGQRKALEDAQSKLAVYEAQELTQTAEQIGGVPVVVKAFADRSVDHVRLVAQHIADGGGVALLGVRANKAQFIFTRAVGLPYDMRAALQAANAIVGGRGGGKPDAAQGGGPDVAKLDEALQAAAQTLKPSNT
jgi:alanyl-tRNA synthetase